MITRPMRERVRVEFHHGYGLTRVAYECVPFGEIDIPTASVPPHLRPIGSRFVIVWLGITPESHDTSDELRAACAVTVEELNDSDG